jgi:3-hydroxyisobutyrate dehydrogenase-like beta-hydroxyacid dehydrogenase
VDLSSHHIHPNLYQSNSQKVNNPVPEVVIEGRSPPAKRNYEGGFVKLAHKDLTLAINAGKSSGTPLAMGTLVEKIYRPLAQPESNFANLDFSSLFKALQENC